MNAYNLARNAHAHIIERIADVQRRLLMNSLAREMFGDDALPSEKLFRSGESALSGAAAYLKREDDAMHRTLAELLPIAREMEALFARNDADKMEAFAEFMAERFRAARAGEE